MRLVKPALLGLIGLSIVILLISALLPDHVMTSKWVRVHAPKEKILVEVKNLAHWKNWNGLLDGAQDIQSTDSMLSWKTVSGDPNIITVKGITPVGLSAEIKLNNAKSFNSGFSIEKRDPVIDSVQVVWYIVEDLKWYPWEKFYGIMAADVKGPLMQQSLNRLKKSLEAE
jgi:hypothetical protein